MTTNGAEEVGTLVNHRTRDEWGLGKVIHATHDHLFVYFRDIEGATKDAIKQFKRGLDVLSLSVVQSDPVLDNLPPLVRGGVIVPPESLRLTTRQAVDAFVRRYRHFTDPEYLRSERDYKWKAHELVLEHMFVEPARSLISDGAPAAVAGVLRRVLHSTNLLSRNELIALNDALDDHAAAGAMARACLRFVDHSNSSTFDDLVRAVGDLPIREGGSRVLTWPTVTLIPFLAAPDRHMFLKPEQTKKTAQSFLFDLLYTPTPNWQTYRRLLELSADVQNHIRALGARDLIDVQSFMWVVNGAPFMQTPKRSGAAAQ